MQGGVLSPCSFDIRGHQMTDVFRQFKPHAFSNEMRCLRHFWCQLDTDNFCQLVHDLAEGSQTSRTYHGRLYTTIADWTCHERGNEFHRNDNRANHCSKLRSRGTDCDTPKSRRSAPSVRPTIRTSASRLSCNGHHTRWCCCHEGIRSKGFLAARNAVIAACGSIPYLLGWSHIYAAALSCVVLRRTDQFTSGRNASQRTPVKASILGQYSAGIRLSPSRQKITDCAGTLMPFARRLAFPAASIASSIGFMPQILHL